MKKYSKHNEISDTNESSRKKMVNETAGWFGLSIVTDSNYVSY